jgi:predicted XRE-type DNA-binding protein
MRRRIRSGEAMEVSSGNVFADLDLPDAAELDTKVRLMAINRLLAARRLTQAETATALSINQPKVSALKHYKLDGYSVERLMGFLTALGSDIENRIRPPQTPTRTDTGRGWLIAHASAQTHKRIRRPPPTSSCAIGGRWGHSKPSLHAGLEIPALLTLARIPQPAT